MQDRPLSSSLLAGGPSETVKTILTDAGESKFPRWHSAESVPLPANNNSDDVIRQQVVSDQLLRNAKSVIENGPDEQLSSAIRAFIQVATDANRIHYKQLIDASVAFNRPKILKDLLKSGKHAER